VAETRQWFDGPIALSGAIAQRPCDPRVRMLGADFAYIGSAFIATTEANAVEGYKQMITASDRGRYRLFKSVHRRARQLFEAVDRRGGDGPRQPSGVRRIEDELGTDASGERAKRRPGRKSGAVAKVLAVSVKFCPP